MDPSIFVTRSITPEVSVTAPGAEAVPKLKVPPGCAEELSKMTVAADAGSNNAPNERVKKYFFIMTSATVCGKLMLRRIRYTCLYPVWDRTGLSISSTDWNRRE